MSVYSVSVCENGKLYCCISESDIDKISENTYVVINDTEYKIDNISKLPVPADEKISPYGLYLGNFEPGDWIYIAEIDAQIKDGVYKTKVITEHISPILLLLN